MAPALAEPAGDPDAGGGAADDVAVGRRRVRRRLAQLRLLHHAGPGLTPPISPLSKRLFIQLAARRRLARLRPPYLALARALSRIEAPLGRGKDSRTDIVPALRLPGGDARHGRLALLQSRVFRA